ncbi:MAG: DNA repair exonuclease [Oscillospiraceae bacterium]|nr:DNA repair exonuclease [Oscillospiraceae bacterium]
MLRIFHGADLHLDTPFTALPPQLAARRRQELRMMSARLAAMARKTGAELVLLAGDLLDGAPPYTETVEALMQALSNIPAPVFIAPGNHDWLSPDSPYRLRWPGNVHVFTSAGIERVPLPGLNCVVYGTAYTEPSKTCVLEGFSPDEADGDALRILLLHGEVRSDGESPYCPVSERQLAESGMDYVALGHIHKFSGIRRSGNTVWAWPGCPEGRGFDETGPRGVIAGGLERGGHTLEFLPVNQKRYEVYTVSLAVGDDPMEKLRELPLSEDQVARVIFTGETEEADLPLRALEEALRERCFYGQVRDETRIHRGLWERLEEQSLTGAFLRRLWSRMEREPEQRPLLEQAARFGLAALERREDPEGGDDL